MKRLFKNKNTHTEEPAIDDAEVAAVDDTWMGTTDEQLPPAGDLDGSEENSLGEDNETPSRRERRQQRQQERKEKHEAKGAGWRGMRGPGGGYAKVVEPAQEFRGTTAQVCGLWPHAAGSASPKSGVPLGHHILNKSTVFCDPISWFEESKLIGNPSAFVLGLPGLGKSTIVRRMEIGLAGNVQPMVLGDTKPDHRVPTEMLGGQVVELARGRGSLNVLDMGALDAAAARLTGSRARALRENAHGRRLTMMSSLIALARKGVVGETESAVLSAALRVLADTHPVDKPAVLADLVTLLENPPQSVRTPTLDRGDDTVYRQEVRALQLTVSALLEGPLGSVFAQPTTTRLRVDAPAICVDVSELAGNDQELEAAVLLATWAEGYATIEAANALADAGLEPQRRFLVVLDELWRILRGAPGMVDRIDALTRLNRKDGVGQIMLTHTLADLRALPLAEDREKAQGFIARAGVVILGGLPKKELDEINEIVSLSHKERDLVSSWSTPPGLSDNEEPPGRGNFLLKIGGRPGIPVHVDLMPEEIASGVHNTNQRWGAPQEHEQPTDAFAVTAPEVATVKEEPAPAEHESTAPTAAPSPEPVAPSSAPPPPSLIPSALSAPPLINEEATYQPSAKTRSRLLARMQGTDPEREAEETAQREAAEQEQREATQRQALQREAEETAQREALEREAEETAQREALEREAEETAQREALEREAEETAQREAAEQEQREATQRQALQREAEETAQREAVIAAIAADPEALANLLASLQGDSVVDVRRGQPPAVTRRSSPIRLVSPSSSAEAKRAEGKRLRRQAAKQAPAAPRSFAELVNPPATERQSAS